MPGCRQVLLVKNHVARVARLTIHRPARRNAQDDVTSGEMGGAVEDLEAGDSFGVLILAGAGRALRADGDLETPGGLVQEEHLRANAGEAARRIAAGPLIATRPSTLTPHKGPDFGLEKVLKLAAVAGTIALTLRDHEEGAAAIRGSREPVYEER